MKSIEYLFRKYPDEIIETEEELRDNPFEINLYFGTNSFNRYYNLFNVVKFYDLNKTYYIEGENIKDFKDEFKEYCARFINLDKNTLKKYILKYIKFKIKENNNFSNYKKKIIASELVKYNLDDEDEKDYRLSEEDDLNVIINDDIFFNMIKQSFKFNHNEFDKSDEKKKIINTYQKIKSIIKDELEEATRTNDESRKKELNSWRKYFDKLLLKRINNPKEVILTESELDRRAEIAMDCFEVKDLLDEDIKNAIIKEVNNKIIITLNDLYNSIQEYHIEEKFFDKLVYEDKKEFYNNDFVHNFLNMGLSICKKTNGELYTKKEILNFLSNKLHELKKITYNGKELLKYVDDDSYKDYNKEKYYNKYDVYEDSYDDQDYYENEIFSKKRKKYKI